MSTKSPLPNHIRQYRELAGLTQNDLALRAQIAAPTLRRYEKGGIVPERVKGAIAQALDKPIERVFPPHSAETTINRRQFIEAAGLGVAGLTIGGGAASVNPAFLGNRHDLSQDEIAILAEDNYGLWELLNALQRGASIQFVLAIAQGKLLTLHHLATCSLLPTQRDTMLNLLADAHLLLGRIARETQDYGTGQQHFKQALTIAEQTGNVDLLAAARQRYGYLLLDLERYPAALANAERAMSEGAKAAYPIRSEVALYAAQCYAHMGQIDAARALAARTREERKGADPIIWFGKLLNPQTSYGHAQITIDVAADRNVEAISAAEDTLAHLDREEPDNLQWRSHIQEQYATALWQLGHIDESVAIATESLNNSRTVGSIANEARIDKLYRQMIKTPARRESSVIQLGALLSGVHFE